MANFQFIKMAAVAIVDFKIFKFLTVETVKRVELHQCAKFRRPQYLSFNIMLVWLGNAYSRPFLGGFWGKFPQMMSLIVLTPKRTILGRNHVI